MKGKGFCGIIILAWTRLFLRCKDVICRSQNGQRFGGRSTHCPCQLSCSIPQHFLHDLINSSHHIFIQFPLGDYLGSCLHHICRQHILYTNHSLHKYVFQVTTKCLPIYFSTAPSLIVQVTSSIQFYYFTDQARFEYYNHSSPLK